MKRLLTLALTIPLVLASCSSGPDPDRELSLQERDNLVATCLQATKEEVYELGGYGGEWLQYDNWDLERGPIEGDTQPFTASGSFTSDTFGDIPVTCESELDVETADVTAISHKVEAPTPNDADLEAAGRQACIEALDKANEPTGNMPTIAHDPQAEFVLSQAEGDEKRGSMTWTATIYTKAGIPWEHMAQCIADVSTVPPKVTHLSAEVPGLDQ